MVGGAWYEYVVVWETCSLLDVLLGACGCVVWETCGLLDVLLGVLLGTCDLVDMSLGESRWVRNIRYP